MVGERDTIASQRVEHRRAHLLWSLARRARVAAVEPLRWYLHGTTHPAGRYRLMEWGCAVLGSQAVHARSVDGRRFLLEFPRDRGWECLYFMGRFETGTTRLLRQILRPTDVVLDAGANIGWFTTLVAAICREGHCHAFEPGPAAFGELKLNCHLNGAEDNVTLNNTALGERAGMALLYSFRERPHVYNSLSPRAGPDGTGVECLVTTIDEYVDRHRLASVDLVKVDVEGAELQVLSGADSLISGPSGPMWLFEVNKRTSGVFGYEPQRIFKRLLDKGEYAFLRVLGGWGTVVPMRTPDDCEHADNVLCVPRAQWSRVASLPGFRGGNPA